MKTLDEAIRAMRSLAETRGLELDESTIHAIGEVFRDLEATPPADERTEGLARPMSMECTDPVAQYAASHDSFTAGELKEKFGHAPESLLAESDVAFLDGRRRLRLRPDARSRIIGRLREEAAAQAPPSWLTDAWTAEPIPDDPVDAANLWTRRLLAGDTGHGARDTVQDLQALLQARLSLAEVELDAGAATASDIRTRLAAARLFEPMRLLIGKNGGMGPSSADRFVGRNDELRALRTHVDALQSQSFSESAHRSVRRLLDAAFDSQSPGVMMVTGRGGMGKSALIAKFVLDHAQSDRDPLLVLHLDFDSATLQPCSGARMLLECVRQARIQANSRSTAFEELEHAIAESILADRLNSLQACWTTFKHLLETTVGEDGTTLVVLDTFETVQTDPEQVEDVMRFIDAFSSLRLQRLRFVAAGRAPAPELLQAGEHRKEGTSITLAPLSVSEAVEMADALGASLPGREWKPAWSRMIAGQRRDDDSRREPLSIRIAVEIIHSALPESRDGLAKQIGSHTAADMNVFVGALYNRRILDHVRNPHARRLAWPGLILRRIDMDVLTTVLGPECGIAPEHLQEAYDALAKEAWIVTRDGSGLRHLSDLRSRTLPLMRSNDPERFAAVNRAAVRYFSKRLDGSLHAQAEWIYHRLLAGEGYESVQRDWRSSMVGLLADAHHDFAPGTEAWSFLLAMTSSRRLAVSAIAQLPPVLALEHISLQWPSLASIGHSKPSPMLAALDLDALPTEEVPHHLANVSAVLRVKTGRWRSGAEFNPSSRLWSDAAGSAERYLLGRSLQGVGDFTSMAPPPLRSSARYQPLEPLCLRLCELVLAAAPDSKNAPGWLQLEQQLEEALYQLSIGPQDRLHRDNVALHSMLRPIAVKSARCRVPAIRLATMMERGTPRKVWSAREARALLDSREGSALARRIQSDSESSFRLLQQGQMQLPFLISNRYWMTQLDNALEALLARSVEHADEKDGVALRRYAAARNSDCIEPLAYAASRATHGKIPAAAQDRISVYSAPEGRAFGADLFMRTKSGSRLDVGGALKLADEAGDLFDMAQIFVDHAWSPKAAEDLDHVLYCLRVRRDYLGEGLGD